MSVELTEWTRWLSGRLGELAPSLRMEARRLLAIAQKHAPRRIAATLFEREGKVHSTDPQASITSTGGTIRPLRARYLLIPLPGQPKNVGRGPDFVTFPRRDQHKRYVKSTRTGELVAVRMKSVNIRGTRWMDKALTEYLTTASQRFVREGRIRLGSR